MEFRRGRDTRRNDPEATHHNGYFMMIRLLQLRHQSVGRRVALVVDNTTLRLLNAASVYELAQAALSAGDTLVGTVLANIAGETVAYREVYSGASEWSILPCFDHPEEPARCLVSGTGLTHQGSAEDRQAMHAIAEAELTDSMKIYRWGLQGGHPPADEVGAAPEWFYKGRGTILRAHGEPLVVPPFSEDGGEEAEIAGVYIIDQAGHPRRIGMTTANEFSDHRLERRNYLYLAPSKLRTCAIGPELVIDPSFGSVRGVAAIERAGERIWSKEIATGEEHMCHSLANIEHHHFKFEEHRRPGDAHIHFFGAAALSFGDGVQLRDGDVMMVAFEGLGRALRNPIRIEPRGQKLIKVAPI
jgi:hypothetical protein